MSVQIELVAPLAPTVREELWRRAQARQEHETAQRLDARSRALLPLALSLARVAARRDAELRAGGVR